MLKRLVFAIAFLPFLLGFGCEKKSEWKAKVFVQRAANSVNGEVLLPQSLWERLIHPGAEDKGAAAQGEHGKEASGHEGGGGGEHDTEGKKAKAPKSEKIETDLKPVHLYFIEQTKGVLGGKNHHFIFPPGGGELDLRDVVVGDSGSFRVVFEFEPAAEGEKKDPPKVWYLSNAKRRQVGRDYVGAGCDSFSDISAAAQTAYNGEGFLIAVSQDRYLSALAGSFFFAQKKDKVIQLSQMTLFDSSKRKLQCRGQ